VTERYAFGIAGVLATDADFQFGVRLTPALDPHLHECTHALSVDRLERIFGHYTQFHVPRQETSGIIA